MTIVKPSLRNTTPAGVDPTQVPGAAPSNRLVNTSNDMNRKNWLKIAAGLIFFTAICQTVISLSPAAAAYFMAPPPLLENRWRLFRIGEAAALIMLIFGPYALSGAGIIRPLPLLRLGLIGISGLFLLRGLFVVFSVMTILGVLEGELLVQGELSTLVFLAAGITYAVGTVLNWRNMQVRT